jgi:hypothetical protein
MAGLSLAVASPVLLIGHEQPLVILLDGAHKAVTRRHDPLQLQRRGRGHVELEVVPHVGHHAVCLPDLVDQAVPRLHLLGKAAREGGNADGKV